MLGHGHCHGGIVYQASLKDVQNTEVALVERKACRLTCKATRMQTRRVMCCLHSARLVQPLFLLLCLLCARVAFACMAVSRVLSQVNLRSFALVLYDFAWMCLM